MICHAPVAMALTGGYCESKLDSMPSAASLPTTVDAGNFPPIIQGGMGVGISGWKLARAVSRCGQLGVVSGTALDLLLTRRLQQGDPGGDLRRALRHFPLPGTAERILSRYFIEGGKPAAAPFRTPPMISHRPAKATRELVMASAFAAIHLAKEGHDGLVGLNLLEKIQTPALDVLFGAMLAGVDVVLVGAGIPRQIPGILDDFAEGRRAEMRLDVTGSTEPVLIDLDPARFMTPRQPGRPLFLAIVSSPVLAENLRRKASGRVDGFVVESATAGGHNAPPRGPMQLTDEGEPVYGLRDHVEPGKFAKIGLPFWLAGGYADPGKLLEARAAGANGIQVGTAFALCEESGFEPALKARIISSILDRKLSIRTAANASPTGFPFKIAQVPDTLADSAIYRDRARVCDLGVLREAYRKPDGGIGFRCSAEPVDSYLAKGGDAEKALGRMCLCNSLCASAGIGQMRGGCEEPPLVTLGDDFEVIRRFIPHGRSTYTAADVVRVLTGE